MEPSGASCSGGSGEQMAASVTGTLSVLGVETADNGTHSDINVLDEYSFGNLLSFLPIKDLKNCRLVNRFWNQVSTRVIAKSKHSIGFSEREEDYGNEDVPEFIQLIQSSTQFPWTKYTVDTGVIDKKQVTNLFRAIAPFVTELSLSNMRQTLFFKDVEFPALRKLDFCYHPGAKPSKWDRKYMVRALEQAPKLNELTLFGFEMMSAFIAPLKTQNCRKITKLLIYSWIEADHLLELSRMGLKLKYLHLSLQNFFFKSKVILGSLRTFLQSQASCLEELRLNVPELDRWVDVKKNETKQLKLECPRMEKLKVLMVSNSQLYTRISYKAQFPELKKLMVYVINSDDVLESFFNDQVEPVETMEELELGYTYLHPELILQAARQFPKLRKIALDACPNCLNFLGHSMSHLKEICLKVSRRVNLDAILTGLSSEEVKALKDLPSNQDALEETREPVHFLKNLRKLQISGTNLHPWAHELLLSDFGCRFALLKMENLQVLEFKGKFKHEISDQVMERMRKKFVVLF